MTPEVMSIVCDQLDIPLGSLVGLVGLLSASILIEAKQGDVQMDRWVNVIPRPIRWLSYVAVSIVILNGGVTNESPFVYFQF